FDGHRKPRWDSIHELSLGAFHPNELAVGPDLDALGDRDRHFSNTRHGLTPRLPNVAENLAAESLFASASAGDDPLRSGHDGGSEPSQNLRDFRSARIDPSTRAGDSLQTIDDRLSLRVVFERDPQPFPSLFLHAPVRGDVALFRQHPQDVFFDS